MATNNALPESVPLPDGKKYHCNFIYNYASRRSLITKDTTLSLKFVEFLVRRLMCWGFTQSYYYDEHARPGADVFDQIFDTVESSMFTFVILTDDFSTNQWVKYSEKAALKALIGKNKEGRDKLIPIVLGNAPVPKELDVNDQVSFDVDENTWDKEHEKELKRLRMILNDGVARAESNFSIQDQGAQIVRSEEGHLLGNPQQSVQGASNNSHNMNEMQMEGLMSSFASIHVSKTQPLPPSSGALQDTETSRTDKEADGDNTVNTSRRSSSHSTNVI